LAASPAISPAMGSVLSAQAAGTMIPWGQWVSRVAIAWLGSAPGGPPRSWGQHRTDEHGNLTDRAILAKYPSRPACSARRLVIEATFTV
jgi:hypothetical protein